MPCFLSRHGVAAGTLHPLRAVGTMKGSPRGGHREPGLLSGWFPDLDSRLFLREEATPWLAPPGPQRLGLPCSLEKISLSRPVKLRWVTQRPGRPPCLLLPGLGSWARPRCRPSTHTQGHGTPKQPGAPPPPSQNSQ